MNGSRQQLSAHFERAVSDSTCQTAERDLARPINGLVLYYLLSNRVVQAPVTGERAAGKEVVFAAQERGDSTASSLDDGVPCRDIPRRE